MVVAFLSAVAVGIGFLLAMCVASLQLGHGIITGAIVAIATLYFFLWFFNAGSNKFHDDDDDDDDDAEPHSVIVIPRDFVSNRSRRSKSKAKKK